VARTSSASTRAGSRRARRCSRAGRACGSGKPGFVSALDALSDYSIHDRLEEIECPTLIVWGTDDRLVPLRDAYEFERLIGDNASVIVYDDTGHVAMLERPDAFNEALERFAADD